MPPLPLFRLPSFDAEGGGAEGQGLPLVHVRTQLEQLQDTLMS